MSDIQSLLRTASGQLGISEKQAGSAVGGLLGMLQDKLPADDAKSLLGALPGSEKLLAAESAQAGGGDLMGGLKQAASGLLGGQTGSALGVMSILHGADIDVSTGGQLLSMVFDLVRKNAGDGLVTRILEQVPDLKGLLG